MYGKVYGLRVVRKKKKERKWKERTSILNAIHLTANDKAPIQTGSKTKMGLKCIGYIKIHCRMIARSGAQTILFIIYLPSLLHLCC